MSDKYEIREEELDKVTGGQITYTWNGTQGTIGIDGNNSFVLVDKDAFGSYYAANKGKVSDKQILRNLMAQGVIKKP